MVPFINDKFPNLKGSTQDTDSFDLYEYIGNAWAVILMHPGDFTPVCTTELGEAAILHHEFRNRGVKVCGFSCSSKEEHVGWIRDIRHISGSTIEFPIFADSDRRYAAMMGVLDSTNLDRRNANSPSTVRAVFVLRPDKTVAHMSAYPASTGRNLEEILRAIDALQLTMKHPQVATPVNWKPGNEVLVDLCTTDAMANDTFGKDGYRIIEVPSEQDKTDLKTHYLRYTRDPSNKALGT